MNLDWLIIDGYSLIHRDPQLKQLIPHNFAEARSKLIRKLETGSGVSASRVTVVFDGQSGGLSHEQGTSATEVYFSPANATADTVIERWTVAYASTMNILVVTSDRLERETVTAAGAQCMSCAGFLDKLSGQRSSMAHTLSRKKPPSFTLGDAFPSDPGDTT